MFLIVPISKRAANPGTWPFSFFMDLLNYNMLMSDRLICDTSSKLIRNQSCMLKELDVTRGQRRRLHDLTCLVRSDVVVVLKLNFRFVANGSAGPAQVGFVPSRGTQVLDPLR